ncbi:MAG: hypothetical protein WCS15_06915 [Prevotella sp.]
MKQFGGLRPENEYLDNLKKVGYVINKTLYNEGSDYIDAISSKRLVLINSFNGRFMVLEGNVEVANESSETLEGVDWYDELLNCLYIPKEAA